MADGHRGTVNERLTVSETDPVYPVPTIGFEARRRWNRDRFPIVLNRHYDPIVRAVDRADVGNATGNM